MKKKTNHKQKRTMDKIGSGELLEGQTQVIIKFFENIRKLSVLIIGVFGTVYSAYGFVYAEKFKNDCASFYELPREYFSADVNYYFLYIVMIVLFGIIFISLNYINKYLKKNETSLITRRIEMCFFIVFFGISLGFINILNLNVIISHYRYTNFGNNLYELMKINQYSSFIITLMMLFSVLFLIAITYSEKVRHISYKTIRSVVVWLLMVVMIIVPVIYVWGAMIKVTSTIADKIMYETTSLNGKDMAILTTVDKQFLVAEYALDKEGKVHIYTDHYLFVNRENLQITYKKFDAPPKIN